MQRSYFLNFSRFAFKDQACFQILGIEFKLWWYLYIKSEYYISCIQCNLRIIYFISDAKFYMYRYRIIIELTSVNDRRYFRRCPPRDSTWESMLVERQRADPWSNIRQRDVSPAERSRKPANSRQVRLHSPHHSRAGTRSPRVVRVNRMRKSAISIYEREIRGVDLTQTRALAQGRSVAYIRARSTAVLQI